LTPNRIEFCIAGSFAFGAIFGLAAPWLVSRAKMLGLTDEEIAKRRKDGWPLQRSFCGKNQNEVKRLVSGPNVCICDECTELAVNIVREDLASANSGQDPSTYRPTD